MNPRVSRSSALASKATGFPIAKIAAKLAIGYTLDELPNDITRETVACFEPSIDYVVVKIPRWNFEKFYGADRTLTTQMKSVGEAMAIGRTFQEALQKGLRSLENDRYGLGADGKDDSLDAEHLDEWLRVPNEKRIFYIREALRRGKTIQEIYDLTKIDTWFLRQIQGLVQIENELRDYTLESAPTKLLRQAKRAGFSDVQLAHIFRKTELSTETPQWDSPVSKRPKETLPLAVRRRRQELNIRASFKRVDTCAAEFEAYTPYLYSTYEAENESMPTSRKKVMILGSGPQPHRPGHRVRLLLCARRLCST